MNASDKAALFGELTLESFRLNARLLSAGDALSADLGLTSARWQVLGTLVLAGEPITVAETARRMGLARQSVQRIADTLNDDGLTAYQANPVHPRWRCMVPTESGLATYQALEERRSDWSAAIIADLPEAELAAAITLLNRIRRRIEALSELGD